MRHHALCQQMIIFVRGGVVCFFWKCGNPKRLGEDDESMLNIFQMG